MCNEVWAIIDDDSFYDNGSMPRLFNTEQKAWDAIAEEVAEAVSNDVDWDSSILHVEEMYDGEVDDLTIQWADDFDVERVVVE